MKGDAGSDHADRSIDITINNSIEIRALEEGLDLLEFCIQFAVKPVAKLGGCGPTYRIPSKPHFRHIGIRVVIIGHFHALQGVA